MSKKIRRDKDYYFCYEDSYRIDTLKMFFGGLRMEPIFYQITLRYKHRLFKVIKIKARNFFRLNAIKIVPVNPAKLNEFFTLITINSLFS